MNDLTTHTTTASVRGTSTAVTADAARIRRAALGARLRTKFAMAAALAGIAVPVLGGTASAQEHPEPSVPARPPVEADPAPRIPQPDPARLGEGFDVQLPDDVDWDEVEGAGSDRRPPIQDEADPADPGRFRVREDLAVDQDRVAERIQELLEEREQGGEDAPGAPGPAAQESPAPADGPAPGADPAAPAAPAGDAPTTTVKGVPVAPAATGTDGPAAGADAGPAAEELALTGSDSVLPIVGLGFIGVGLAAAAAAAVLTRRRVASAARHG